MWTYNIYEKNAEGKKWYSGCLKNGFIVLWFYVDHSALMFDSEAYSILRFWRSWVSDKARLENELQLQCDKRNFRPTKPIKIK